jgi:hypothetical protein
MVQTPSDHRQSAADLMDAFNRASWNRFRAIVAHDVVYNEIGTGRHIEGVNGYIKRW